MARKRVARTRGLPSGQDHSQHGEWNQRQRDGIATDFEHPDCRQPVGFEGRLAHGEGSLALEGQGLGVRRQAQHSRQSAAWWPTRP